MEPMKFGTAFANVGPFSGRMILGACIGRLLEEFPDSSQLTFGTDIPGHYNRPILTGPAPGA